MLNFSLLAESQNFINFAVDGISTINLNWLSKIIQWIFNLFSDVRFGVALGVIVFTLILKTIVLPLDIYSRVKTKKQSLIMESISDDMKKLQKQYANDKAMYQQKVMEIQRAHGYNPLGACLPMIISLVIFMVVFGAFSTYSNYATLNTYNDMVDAYAQSVEVYVMTDASDPAEEHFLIGKDGNYKVEFDRFSAYYAKLHDGEAPFKENMKEAEKFEIVASFVQLNARQASAECYRNNKYTNSFLWIGNIWYPDSMLNKEVPDFTSFSNSIARAVGAGMSSTYVESYNEVTFDLSKEKSTYNGYFVLILLAIGFMLLQQVIMMRSQKAANELSTVDGSAAKTNKWMMIIMPIMFGVFSFFYSAAFSIYMITNTVYGLISTVIINKIVSVRFEKNADKVLAKSARDKMKRLK